MPAEVKRGLLPRLTDQMIGFVQTAEIQAVLQSQREGTATVPFTPIGASFTVTAEAAHGVVTTSRITYHKPQ